jgi:hypothetical protein
LYPLQEDGDARNTREDQVPVRLSLATARPQAIWDATRSEDGLFDRLLEKLLQRSCAILKFRVWITVGVTTWVLREKEICV